MAWVAVAVAGAGLVGSFMASDAQSDASSEASASQQASAQLGIDEQRRQFDAVQKLLNPFVTTGTQGLTAQGNLAGLNGNDAQASAIAGIQGSPQFGALAKQGEDAILANASATGGLRGGNVQGALAQFRPALLSSLIDQQYARLGGLTSVGQNAAAGVGNAGMATGNSVAQLLQQQGAAAAGGALGQGRATVQGINGIAGTIGQVAARGGFGGTTAPAVNDGGYSVGLGSAYQTDSSGMPLRAGGF